MDEEVLVAGGGIAGLASALALARVGYGARVLEQASQFHEIGAGIQLGPNLVRALDVLGLRDDVLARSWFPPTLRVRDAITSAELTSIDAGDGFIERFGEPYALVHRADLLNVMLDACAAEPGIELLSGQKVASIRERDSAVVVETTRGDVFEGRALVGADGLWSCVREHVLDDGPPRVSGHIAYRGVLGRNEVPDGLWAPDMTAWVGPRLHLVHYPIRDGSLFNLVAVFHSDRYTEGYDAPADPAELQRHFAGTHSNVRTIIERIDTWKYWVLCDREPRRGWSRGRITLVGDAAHAMLQYLGQGAAMAVEDAVQLAHDGARLRRRLSRG